MRRLTAVAALAVLVATAGCQHHQTRHRAAPVATAEDSSADLVSSAYQRTAAAKSAKLTFNEVGTFKGQSISVTGLGAIDFASKNVDFTLTVPPFGSLRTVKIGTVIYEKLPPNLVGALGGKSWIKLDLSKVTDPKVAALVKQLQGGNQDPTDILAYLKGVSARVRKVGTESVHGERTTHYAATVDATRAAAQMGPEAASALKELLSSAGGDTFPVDIWLDGDNRVRQIVSKIPSRGGAPLVNTVQFYDFGTPVNATPPPAADTTDLATLADLAPK